MGQSVKRARQQDLQVRRGMTGQPFERRLELPGVTQHGALDDGVRRIGPHQVRDLVHHGAARRDGRLPIQRIADQRDAGGRLDGIGDVVQFAFPRRQARQPET